MPISFIIWNFNPDLLTGSFPIRWYGLFFALGFLISQQVLFYIFKMETGPELTQKKEAEKLIENLTVYMIIATIVGARLGHVFFYQPKEYLADPIRILNIREGGLASHGAAIGIILAIWLFSKFRFNPKEGSLKNLFFLKADRNYGFFQIIDRVVIVVALTGCLVRFGNFTNSEIIGKPTHGDWGVVFAREVTDDILYDPTGSNWVESVEYHKNPDGDRHGTDDVPIYIDVIFKNRPHTEGEIRSYLDNGLNMKLSRHTRYLHESVMHNLEYNLIKSDTDGSYAARISTLAVARQPSQLYESGSSLLLFGFLFFLWTRKKKNTPPGQLFGLFLVILFSLRFLYEFTKENQVAFEDNMRLNMGQWLSIPMVVLGILVLIYSSRLARSQGTGS